MGELTDREREILSLEAEPWTSGGKKEAAIRDRLDLSSTAYHQLLNTLLDREEALAAYPMLVARLRRIRGR